MASLPQTAWIRGVLHIQIVATSPVWLQFLPGSCQLRQLCPFLSIAQSQWKNPFHYRWQMLLMSRFFPTPNQTVSTATHWNLLQPCQVLHWWQESQRSQSLTARNLKWIKKYSQLDALVWRCSSVQVFAPLSKLEVGRVSVLKRYIFTNHKTVVQFQLLFRQNVQGSISARTLPLLYLVIESCQSVHDGLVNSPNFSRGW